MEKGIFRQIKLHIAETNKDQPGKEAVLFVTDDAVRARELAADGKAVLGVLTPENRTESFEGVRFLTEEFDESDIFYLERVYRRYVGLPWTILETDRLFVRESTEADTDVFFELYKEPEINRFMHDLALEREERIRSMERYRESMYGFYEFGIWTVILKETGEIIGRAGLDMHPGFPEPEIGFVIGKSWQGQGFAKEVCSGILEYAYDELFVEDVLAFAEPENVASRGLLAGLGFVPCGVHTEKGRYYIQYTKKGTR